jgi:DNA-binding FadR family transcriptional regulator
MNDLSVRSRFEPLAPRGEVKVQRVFEAICGQIRTELTAGRLRPGDKLPAERDLALQFASSRTAVREALRSLEMAGVVALRKGVKGGAFIREGDPRVVTQSISDMLALGRISLQSLTESRVIIQDAVIRLACERGTAQDFDALDESIDRTELLTREERHDERRLQLVQFYRLLSQATRNEVMVILVESLTQIVLDVLARLDITPRPDTVGVQRRIIALLRKGQADKAAAAMSAHLEALHQHLFKAQMARVVVASPVRRKAVAAPERKAPVRPAAKPAPARKTRAGR